MAWSLLLAAVLAAEVPGDGADRPPAPADRAWSRTGLDIPLLSGPSPADGPAPATSSPRPISRLTPLRTATNPTPVPPPAQGPVLEPPLTGPAAPTAGVAPAPPALSDVPLIDRQIPVPDSLDESVPPLLGPEGIGEPQPLPSPVRPGTLTLDVVPDEPARSPGSGLGPLPDRRARPGLKDPDRDFGKDDDLPLDLPPRRGGLFRRLMPGNNAPRSVVPPPRDDGGARRDRDLDRDDEDPAADAAFRRQLDRAVRAAGSPHLKSQEILVRDRKVWIRLKADRFWNRRALRKSVETLPILAGYDVRVDVE